MINWNKMDSIFDGMNSVFENMNSLMDDLFNENIPKSKIKKTFKTKKVNLNNDNFYFSKTIKFTSPTNQKVCHSLCEKCGNDMSVKYCVIDETRDCLFYSCSNCDFKYTKPTKDFKGNFDLPTVDEINM